MNLLSIVIAAGWPIWPLMVCSVLALELTRRSIPDPRQIGQLAQLAHGILVSLYNTAFGLVVAIPSLMFWRYFRSTVDRYVLTLEIAAERFARHLEQVRG